jgi:hypothetical protein
VRLWLQVLFTQGYLWSDRFPEAFADTRIKGRVLGSWMVFPVTLVALGTLRLTSGGVLWLGVATLGAGVFWVAWRVSALMLQRSLNRREVVISVHWASGLMIFVLLWLLIFAGLARGEWVLALVSIAFQLDPGTAWLWDIENNYLLFRDPSRNQWRIEAHARTGWISPVTLIRGLTEAYVLMPAEILGLRKERHAH